MIVTVKKEVLLDIWTIVLYIQKYSRTLQTLVNSENIENFGIDFLYRNISNEILFYYTNPQAYQCSSYKDLKDKMNKYKV